MAILQKYKLSQHLTNQFYKMPKWLNYLEISSNTKIVYIMLLDRNSVSIKNKWIDEDNNIFFYYKQEELASSLNLSRKTVINSIKELEKLGLLETVKGFQKISRTYLLQPSENYILELYQRYQEKINDIDKKTSEPLQSQRCNFFTHQDVKKLHISLNDSKNNNSNNNIYNNNIYSPSVNNNNNLNNKNNILSHQNKTKEGMINFVSEKMKKENKNFKYENYKDLIDILIEIYVEEITVKKKNIIMKK